MIAFSVFVITLLKAVITNKRKTRLSAVLHDLFICVTEVSCKTQGNRSKRGQFP